ncbi:hypothetical protein EZJ49_16365 [Bdellovibrio bacteriovorus]|uniref:hypothetical protein n=1 Tax=Bdellovibrio bacteriovorus TaxID=959 RepID=UPI0021CE2168|nr:hypothetical protein [Bdellovibrio bacteriovorus]UXR64636.1 hypothetical protein EZJ49_16365 [Bdellovibrio bacteriovorus]
MKPLKKILIVIFFSVNVGIMIADGLPDQSALGARFISLVSRYQAAAMLYQPWSMFAPNPMNTTAFVQADLLFDDGSTAVWKLPRPQELPFLRQVLTGDRYRILGQETLLPQHNDLVWFDLSRYITREVMQQEVARNSGRTLKEIQFKRFESRILLPPEGTFIPHGQRSNKFNITHVFHYLPTYERVRHEVQNSQQSH